MTIGNAASHMPSYWVAFALGIGLAACSTTSLHRYPLADVVWEDPDRHPFRGKPGEHFAPWVWDAADYSFFRPLSRAFRFETRREAVNVNAFDEVPSSSWFHNRMGRFALSPERLAQAACDGPPLDPNEVLVVTAAKPGGANPGFIVEDQAGQKYLLKFDSARQPETGTLADVIASILYWGAGYHTPCNRIVYLNRERVFVDGGAWADVAGRLEPITDRDVDDIVANAPRLSGGRIRAMASRFIPGEPLGPWRYEGTRADDPNDVIPHENRRELRGSYVLASLVNHFDSREHNSLATWIETSDQRGFVRHYLLDFGDSLGSVWQYDEFSRQHGHAYYVDFGSMAADLFTLGLIERPWERNQLGPAGEVLGYYDVENFQPDAWRPGYPNPAMSHMTEADAAWMARIIARFSDQHLLRAITEARIQNDVARNQLARTLLGRRDRILQRWFARLSPLTDAHWDAERESLCVHDLRSLHRVFADRDFRHVASVYVHREDARDLLPAARQAAAFEDASSRVCWPISDLGRLEGDLPRYLIVDAFSIGDPAPLRLHVYQLAARSLRVVAIERPSDFELPLPLNGD